MPKRTVFFVSDGTGITAETFGNAILAQFDMKSRHVRLPFTDTIDKAHQAVRQINHTAETEGNKPIVFTTLVNMTPAAPRSERTMRWTPADKATSAWAKPLCTR